MTLLMLFSYSIGIIFLEARLYSVGSTVFGLSSVASLFSGKQWSQRNGQKLSRSHTEPGPGFNENVIAITIINIYDRYF